MSNVHDKNIKLIYDKLTSKGVDMGTLEETTKALRSDPRNGRLLYDMGTKHGYDMGSYEEFEEAMGLPKFQAPFKSGEEPIEVKSAQPKAEEPKQEDDYLTSDMPEEVEPEEEYDFNREVLKDYVPQFKNEIKEKFPNARLYGFTRPMQMSTTGTGGITPNPNYGTPITLTEEEKAQRDSLDYQLKRGQITKEQYADQISAINKQATDRLNDQFSEDALNASAALHLMNQAQKRVKLVDGRTKSNVVNAFRGVGHFDYAGLNPALQFVDAYRSFALLNKVAENPDAELSESEQYLLQAIVTNNAVNDTFQTNMAERIGQGLPESMAFMAQFALTDGVGSAVGKLAKEGVEKVIKKGLKNATRRLYDDGFKGLAQKGLDRTLNTVIPGVVGATTAAATQTILNPAGLASGTYERAAGTAEYTLAPDGTPIATGEVTGRMGLGEAFAKEFGAQTIEQLSERAGASLGIGLGAGKAVAKTTGKAIASKVPGVQKAADAFVEFADNMKKTKVGDLVGKAAEWLENKDLGVKALAQKVGWNGTIEEWYEEQANTLLNAMFVGDEELSALFNGERQLETFLSVAVVGGATRLLSAPAAIEQRAEVRKEKQNLKNTISDIEKRVQGNSTLSNALKAVATAVDTGTVEDVALAINEANRQLNLDTDTKRMLLDYASARMMSNMWRSNDRRQASKLAEGVYAEVEARTHKQSGTITVVEYTDKDGNKQNVDIIDGVIIRDGVEKIDSTLSDRSVVVRMQDGTTQMVPSKSLGNIVEEINPAQYRAKLANASARDMAATLFSEYSARTNEHGVYYNEDGSLDYYHATPAQTALSLIDELGSAEAAAEYAANQINGLASGAITSTEGGDGMSIEAQNALSKWQAVSGLLADITAYNAQQAAAAEGKVPEGVEPMENPLPVDAAAPARNLRTGDRLRLTIDNGEMAEATIGGKTADGNYLVDFDDTVTIGGKKGVSHELTPEVIAAMQYVEEVQEGDAELQAEQTPEQDDVTSYKDMVIGRIPLKADGSRNWEAATPAEAAQAINAERDGDFDASIAFAQQMAQNCANAVSDLANTELEVEDPTNADMVAAAEAQRAQAIASMQKTADFWSEVTNILNTANTERTTPAEQETPVEDIPTPEDAMPMIDEDTPDFVSAGPERSAEFLSEQFGDDAESFIQDNIAEAQKALADAQGKKPKSTNFAERKKENEAIAQEKVVATAALDFWNAVGAAYAARQSAVAEEVAQPEVVESAEQPATAVEEPPVVEEQPVVEEAPAVEEQPEVVESAEQPATAAEETPVEEIATEEKAEENKEVSDVNSEKDTNFVGESEATPQETAEEEITVEMVENTDLDEVIKVMAIDYLNGNVNVATKAAYDAVKDYVRNISTVRPADSTDAGRAQLGEGADDAGSLASGQSRGVSGDLDSREDDGVVSDGDGVRSEAGEDDLAEPSGIGSDNSVGTGGHEPDVVSGIVSSGRVRSGSDSERGPSSRNPRRGKGSSNGVSAQNEGGRGETQRGGDTRDSQEREVKEQEVKEDLARHIQELKDILANPMGEAKGALLDVTSVFGMFGVNAIKVMGATAKIGMDLVKLGYYKFKKWSAAMHEQLDGVFHSQTELTDELIDEFIRAMWDTSFKYRGEVRKISEWASLLEAEQLRAMMRMGIEEKRKLQKAAESEPTILSDIENIRKSLPFLLPAQQEDVEKAEFQFFDESHKDAAYGYGKGYMFTNGTGTGKTYTGLGIIKRFIKQGKGRILIVTASGEKIDDWVKDAKNLGITATRLADTKSKGKGVVVTQYANLRQNYELLKDEFDLIVYDESHKLMENQAGEDTNAAAAHYMITNRDAEQAILRTLQDTPLWKEPRKLEEELKELVSLLDAKKLTSEQLKRAEQLGGKVVMEERVSAIRARLTEIAKLQEAEVKKQLQDPNKRAAAEAAVARTKVVFLSATPFNTALNLDYVEGYIFSYPTEEGKERDREKDKERFIMDKFPSSHRRAKQGVVRIDETQIQDADAVTAEEIAFSDYLQNSLHTMSGRGLDSEWDYSREFPKLEVTGARLVNAAIAALTTGKYNALRPYFKHLLDDYAQSTAFFEVIKTSASIERIKEHIALGRKVVVFHRRMSSTEPLEPPFARGLDNADHDDRASAEMIHAFRREFAELLAWEQSLDYRFPQDILMEAFATEEEKAKYQKEQEEYGLKLMNHALGIEKRKPKAPKLRSARVGVFNGNETEAEKHKAVDAFNTDGSECSLLVVQVAAGKEGISLHDKTGKHQRVMMSMQLPQSPIEFVQAEGRIYRVGNKSNAIFEYPVLGIDQEIIGFAAKINGRAATTENLALGSRARGLRNSISRAMLASREIPVSPTQGVGGKQLDSREEWEKTDYDGAIEAYNNRNTESEATTDFNEQDTPEPIGYKMMEWARPEAGESILEPAAGTGTMAQYAPQKSRLTAIEIITNKFATLITKVGGSGRKLLNEDFMGFDKRNKFDCVVMNTPHTGEVAVNALIAPQGVPQKEFEFLDKVFGHINEGGRVVALIEEKNADTTIKAVTNLGRNRVVVGEVKLPAFAFPNANGGTATRVVVFDVVSNEALRSVMPEKVFFDLSGETTPQGLFEAMRDVQMPERTIDKVARLAKKLQKFEAKFKSFKNVVQRGKNYRTGKMEQEVNFDADRAFLSVRTAQGGTYRIGVGGYYFNLYIRGNEIAAGNMGEITNLCNVYKSLKQITDAQTDEEFRYLTRNYEPKTYPEIRDFLEVCKDAIRTALGKTESQIINIAEGRVENELRGELTFKQMKDAFEGLSHGDVTLDDLSKKVFEVVGKIEGLRFYTKSGLPSSTVAYYTPKENAIVINEDTWNSLRLTDGIKAQTVVHEMIHAVTCYYLDAYERGVSFSAEINQACQDILDVYKAITADRSFEAGLMQGSKQGDNATYGLTSVQEMIAELANPKFRVQLKLKKLWRQLVNGIKKLLGINLEMGDAQETTALETLENALDTLLSNYDPEYYAQYIGFVNASPNPMEFVRFRTKQLSREDKRYQTEEIFGGIWIEDKEEYAKFASSVKTFPREENGEGVAFTDNYFYAYYRNIEGQVTPFVSVYMNRDESQDVVNQVNQELENVRTGERIKKYIDTAISRAWRKQSQNNDNNGDNSSVSTRSRDGVLGSHLLRTGRYYDHPELYVKTSRANANEYDDVDTRHRTASEEARQRVIAAQAQTLSTAEIEEYINEVAKSLPEGVKVVVTNSTESGDREHSGWYDMGTDTVYINADMCDNTADVDATIVHELVGHRAMPTAIARVIGSKNIADRITLYTKLSRMLPEELKAKVMAKTAAGMDLGVAVDEVLAEEVETANLVKPDLWSRICAEVRALFRKVFNRGLSLSDNDIKYMFWLAAHNINNDAEFVAAEEMRYRTGVAEFKRNSALPTEEQQEYDAAVISKSQQFVEEWVDSLNPLKKLQETVAKHHGELKSWEDAYDIELGRASRTMARFNMMAERFLKPLFTAVSAFTNNGISRETLMYYMIAKHGLERNEYARRQAHQELNSTILEAIQKVATENEYEGLSDVEKAAVVKSMFADYLDHLDSDEIVRALEFFASSPDTDFIGIVVALEAVPLEDVSGLTGLAEKLSDDPDAKPEEIFTEFAESLVEEFEGENQEAVNTLWDKVRDLTNATLLYQTEGGILSQEQYQHLRSMYRYYIPLRGWDGPNSRDYYEYSTSPARHQTVVKAAKGRKSLAEDPIANMANMLQSAVTIVEKNASKQAFVRMALNRPDSSVVRIVKVRYEKRKNASTGKTEWVAVSPDFNEDATAEEIDAAIAGFDEQTKLLVAEGKARVKRSQVDVGVRVLPANLNDHYVKAMINGEEVAVIVNGSPAAALALNGTNVPAYDQALQSTIGKATRFFARTHTTWAPKFVVTNFLRDYGYGSLTSFVKYGARYAKEFQKNTRRAMWVLPKMLKEGITQLSEEQLNDYSLIDNTTLRYFVEFLTNGGETGFSQSLTTEEWKKEIEKQVNALSGSDPKKAVNALLKLLESANRYAEDIPRFAAYLTSREMGKNVSESIKDAKEITVNFSRHGAGGMGNSILRKLFAFVNAGIQGLYNLTALAKEHPERFYPAMGAIFLSGFAFPFLNILLISAFGDDDDERNYKYMSEFNNTNRLVLFNPFGKEKGFLTLPISHELVPFYGLGNIFSRRLMGYDADVSLGGQIATTIMSAAPLDFVSASAQGVSFRSFIPSVAQPVYDVFQNRDFMGRPIYRSYDYNTNRGDAAFTKAPIDTWEWLVGLSNLASRATGGDGIIMPGLADFHISDKDADVQLNNPAITQYLLESYLGGALQSASKLVNLGKGVVAKMTDDETRAEEYLAAYNLPLISGLYRFSNETSANSRIKEAYDHYKNDISKQCERAVKTYMEELPSDLNLWPKAAIDALNSTEYQIYRLFKDYDKPIRKAEKLLNEAYDRKAPKAEIDELKRVIMAAKMELIEAASDIQLRGVATKMQDNN